MATSAQRARRRRQRQKKGRCIHPGDCTGHILPAGRSGPRGGRGRRGGGKKRGILAGIGNMLLPGIGGMVGQMGDNLVGSAFNGFMSNSRAAPVAQAGRMRSNQIHKSREYGQEELAVIEVPQGTPAGTIVTQALLAAPNLGVRFAKFAELWSNTRFLNLWFTVTAANPSTVGGGYTIAIDPDPVQSYSSGDTLPARLLALTQASRANAWADAGVWMLPKKDVMYNKFHTASAGDAEIREYAIGQFIMATHTEYDSDCKYSINVHWDVEFERPDTQQGAGEPETPTYVLRTAGVQGEVPLTDNTLFDMPSSDVWNLVPPLGIYFTLPGTLSLSSSSFGAKPIQAITVLAGGTTQFTCTSGNFGIVGSTPIVDVQNPATLYLDAGVFALEKMAPGKRFVRTGYALVHPYHAKNGHQLWYNAAQAKLMARLQGEAAKRALMNRLVHEFEALSTDELENRARPRPTAPQGLRPEQPLILHGD